jgi:ABC-type antimicrobial peptide transport system permease subunit
MRRSGLSSGEAVMATGDSAVQHCHRKSDLALAYDEATSEIPVIDFKLSWMLIVEGVAMALVVGLIGGLFPALRAARLPIVQGLYAS